VSLYFLDSSALVKRYVAEAGSSWIQSLAEPTAGHALFIARITWIEVLSALARRQP
jgi:predicted nucleic acid-binding protein